MVTFRPRSRCQPTGLVYCDCWVVIVMVVVVTVIVMNGHAARLDTNSHHVIPSIHYCSHQRNVCVISDVLDSRPCDQKEHGNQNIPHLLISRLIFVHSVSRFQVLFLCPLSARTTSLAQPFQSRSSFRLPKPSHTYPRSPYFRPVPRRGLSGSPGLSWLSVGSVVTLPGESESDGALVVVAFVRVMMWMYIAS